MKKSLYFGSLQMSFKSIVDFRKKISNLVSLRASIVFTNSIIVKNYIYWTCEWNMRSVDSIHTKTVKFGQV